MTRPRLVLVSPRPPRADGQGDQRRAQVALESLSEDWDVDVISWLPDAEESLAQQWKAHPGCLLRTLVTCLIRPLHVAYVQSLAPQGLVERLAAEQVVLYMTDRAVPMSPPKPYVIDFIDDLGGAASRRAASAGRLASAFWRWEGWRLRRLDTRLAAGAAVSLAISDVDAAAIHPAVQTIPPAIGSASMPDEGTKIVFTGNLFYAPNLEAAIWICEALVPELRARGVDPDDIVEAGSRPPKVLVDAASAAGIDLRGDVPSLDGTLREAAVVLSPVVFGSGVQNKVLDAVGAGRACVLTPFTNQALGLVDSESAFIRDRSPNAFAEAIVELCDDRDLRSLLTENARRHLQSYSADVVAQRWRECLGPARDVADPAPDPGWR